RHRSLRPAAGDAGGGGRCARVRQPRRALGPVLVLESQEGRQSRGWRGVLSALADGVWATVRRLPRRSARADGRGARSSERLTMAGPPAALAISEPSVTRRVARAAVAGSSARPSPRDRPRPPRAPVESGVPNNVGASATLRPRGRAGKYGGTRSRGSRFRRPSPRGLAGIAPCRGP